ncbi:MAG: AAA family ATPase [Candidatus Cloacimonetes bacterium]|nr:AAA family ATPase [Candidatus Cloacimonadota bacterium]
MLFWRKTLDDLRAWAASPYRRSLILRGARQVGKTTVVRLFAADFDTFIELNLERENDRDLFFSGTEVQKVLNNIKIAKNIGDTSGKTLLFIDEIQNSANALLSLRYFYELMPELYVVAAGSLLDAYLAKGRFQVSVGRIEYLWVYPLDFEEYLNALDLKPLLQALDADAIPQYIYPTLRTHYTEFAMVGAMPEVVKIWQQSRDIAVVRGVQAAIVAAFRDDVAKYAANPAQNELILQVLDNAYQHVSKRISFENYGGTAARSDQVKAVFQLLEQVNLFFLLYPTSALEIPALPKYQRRPKLLAYDLGMVNYVLGIQDNYYGNDDLHSIFKGAAMEQMVGQELRSLQHKENFKLKYWVRDRRNSSAEIDYLLDWQGELIPVEVKAGKSGSMKSLFIFMDEAKTDIAIRIHDGLTAWEELTTSSGKKFRLLNLNLALVNKVFGYLKKG